MNEFNFEIDDYLFKNISIVGFDSGCKGNKDEPPYPASAEFEVENVFLYNEDSESFDIKLLAVEKDAVINKYANKISDRCVELIEGEIENDKVERYLDSQL